MSTLQVNSINSFTPSDPVTINDSFKVTGSSTFTGSVSVLANGNDAVTLTSTKPVSIPSAGLDVNGDITGSGNTSFGFGSAGNRNHIFTGSLQVTESNHFKVTSVSSSIVGLPKVSGVNLTASPHSLSSGELFTISGSQLFSADLIASGSVPDAITGSLFVLMKA